MKDDPGRVMFRQFQGAIAQCEKANIVLKLRGARQRIKTGRCEGRKPYGANEGEQAIIAEWGNCGPLAWPMIALRPCLTLMASQLAHPASGGTDLLSTRF